MALGSLVVWRVYSRFRRMVGRQRLSKYRAPITLAIFPALVVLVALPSLSHPDRLLWLAVAVASGFVLGLFGLHRTRFEAIAGHGLFYTPNAHSGDCAVDALHRAHCLSRLRGLHRRPDSSPQSHRVHAKPPHDVGLRASGRLLHQLRHRPCALACSRAPGQASPRSDESPRWLIQSSSGRLAACRHVCSRRPCQRLRSPGCKRHRYSIPR